MVGLLFGMLTRPHAVGPDGIRVRYGTEVDIALDWGVVRSVTRRPRTLPDRTPKVTVDDAGEATLHMEMQKATNLEIALRSPVAVRLPHGSETVSRVDLHADDPDGFLQAVSRHRPEGP